MYSSTRGRISGYAGHIPGLQHTLEVNNSEYSQFEFEHRSPHDDGEHYAYRGEDSSPTQRPIMTPPAARLSPNPFPPRARVMGYQGHVPGIITTYGVINSDYQNGEYLQRLTDPIPNGEERDEHDHNHGHSHNRRPKISSRPHTSSRPQTPGERVAEAYRERAEQVRRSEQGPNSRPNSRHNSRPNSRAASVPHPRPSSSAVRNPDLQTHAQVQGLGMLDHPRTPPSIGHPASRNYQVEDYLSNSRAISFSGYMPRKKFMVGI